MRLLYGASLGPGWERDGVVPLGEGGHMSLEKAVALGRANGQVAIWDGHAEMHGVAVWDDEGFRLVQLGPDRARRVLERDPELDFQRRKWLGMMGQARKPVEEQEGRLIVIDPDRVQRILAEIRDASSERREGEVEETGA
jgi:hypothetical protein